MESGVRAIAVNAIFGIVYASLARTAIGEGVRQYAPGTDNADALWRKTEDMVGETF